MSAASRAKLEELNVWDYQLYTLAQELHEQFILRWGPPATHPQPADNAAEALELAAEVTAHDTGGRHVAAAAQVQQTGGHSIQLTGAADPSPPRVVGACMSPLCVEAARLGPLPVSFYTARGRERPSLEDYAALRDACGLSFLRA